MTAYELADELDKINDIPIETIINMLRQQADRIGVLEASHKIQVDIVDKQNEYIALLEQGLRSSIDLNKAQAARYESEYIQNVKKAAETGEEG